MLPLNTGVTYHDSARSTPGYVLFAPSGGHAVHLIDYEGAVAHSWATIGTGVTFWTTLLPNGNLFVNERADVRRGVELTGSGLMREYDRDSNLIWEHYDPYQHHDARRLPNGRTAYLAYTELDAAAQARVKGGVPGSESPVGLCGEAVREIDADGEVVWERHLTEFGDQFPLHRNANRWSTGHTNTISPLADGNYLISCKTLNLLFILDRQSGEITWHFQNDNLSGQHDAQMLDNGNILVFANGAFASDLHHSEVWEIDPTTNDVVWRYWAKDNPQSFFSPHVGGCQRLPSGNTLVCEGAKGCNFEVTPDGDVVWEYVCPWFNTVDGFGRINWLFRSRHYVAGSPELSAVV